MIREEFAFLEEQGFAVVRESDGSVRYERGDGLFVEVFRDPREAQTGFRIGLTSRPSDALDASELSLLSGKQVRQVDYSYRAPVRAGVARAADQLRTHGERPLAGDTTVYQEAMVLRAARTRPSSQ